MGIPDQLTCLLRNLYAGQEATVRTGHRTDWFQIGKGVCQSCILSPCLFNLYAEYIMRNARLDEAQAGIKIARRNISNLRYADDTTLIAESEEEIKRKEPLDERERGAWKSRLKTQHLKSEDHGIWSHHFMANRWGNSGNSDRLSFLGLQNHCRWWLQPWNFKTPAPWKKSYDQPRQHIKKQRHYFADKGLSNQSCGFSSSHVYMWGLGHKESWVLKNWCFWTVVLEKTLEGPLDCKEINPVNPKGNQSWIFIGRTDDETEAPMLWPPDAKNWLIGKDLDVWKDWRQEEKGMTEDEMVGWHHQLNGHEFEQALGVGDGHGSLACCSPWVLKESDKTD